MVLVYNSDQYLSSLFSYQFHSPLLSKSLLKEEIRIENSRKTQKPRYIYLKNELFGTVRATTGRLVLSMAGAIWIHQHLPKPQFRVVVDPDIFPFLKQGGSLFAKFIIDCDPDIRIGDEVLVVDPHDKLVASGRAKLNGEEMIAFQRGPAVKIHILIQ